MTEQNAPKGYWVGHVDVLEPVAYNEYARAAILAVRSFGGRYLVRAGQSASPEGVWRARAVVIEFDSYQQALDCYHSPANQAAKALRAGASEADLLIIAGSAE